MKCTGYAWENLICGKCLIWLLELRNFTAVGFYELLNLLSYPWRGALKTLPGVRAEILFYVIQMGCCRIITIDLCAHLQWFLYPTRPIDRINTSPHQMHCVLQVLCQKIISTIISPLSFHAIPQGTCKEKAWLYKLYKSTLKVNHSKCLTFIYRSKPSKQVLLKTSYPIRTPQSVHCEITMYCSSF